MEVEDATQVLAEGRCLEASPVNQMAEFVIDPENAPFKANATVKILCTFCFNDIVISAI